MKGSKATSPEKEVENKSYDRETFIVRADIMEQIRDIAYWDRQLIKETVEAAFTNYITSWAKKHGEIKTRPEEVKEREKVRSNSGRKKGEK